MLPGDSIAAVGESGNFLRKALPEAADARILIIAGSGLGGFVRAISIENEVSYNSIPHVGGSTVEGHAGKLVLGKIDTDRTPILLMAGRRHLYEGLSAMEAAHLPQSVFSAFPGIETVIISNAAGGLNPAFEVGNLMLISDQINWMFQNPLIGRNNDEIGPRFPDVSDIYSSVLRDKVRQIAVEQGINLREGIYIAMHGPNYETRAEVAMLRHMLGADAVGMSTIPEALVAAHAGKQTVGISFISNTLTNASVTTHEEVVANSALVEDRFRKLVSAVISKIHSGS